MGTLRVMALVTLALAVSACSTKLQQLRDAGFDIDDGLQTGEIELRVQSNGTRLIITNAENKRCDRLTGKNEFKRGCFNVDRGDQGLFTFKFRQKSDEQDYYFSGYQICEWPDTTGKTKPDRNNCGLTLSQRRDFSVEVGDDILSPDENGRIDLSNGGKEELPRFDLWDSNIRKATYFYWVDVCPKGKGPGSPDCLSVDPGSRNGGIRR